jgi:hypothetical protein
LNSMVCASLPTVPHTLTSTNLCETSLVAPVTIMNGGHHNEEKR